MLTGHGIDYILCTCKLILKSSELRFSCLNSYIAQFLQYLLAHYFSIIFNKDILLYLFSVTYIIYDLKN